MTTTTHISVKKNTDIFGSKCLICGDAVDTTRSDTWWGEISIHIVENECDIYEDLCTQCFDLAVEDLPGLRDAIEQSLCEHDRAMSMLHSMLDILNDGGFIPIAGGLS